MSCENRTREWPQQLDAFLDGELASAAEQSVREHLRACPLCAADALDRMIAKRAIQSAGLRFGPDPAFRARVQRTISAPARSRRAWRWPAAMAFAAAAVVVVAVLATSYFETRNRDRQLVGELVDLHVATLASSNPVDVISSDRHTVKPWFEGKLPFTFDLPELEGTPFSLVGGRVSYLNQSVGAELVFRIRQHNVSVFIFPERAVDGGCSENAVTDELNFHLRSWSRNGLCYFAIGDVNQDDLDKLAALMNK